MNRWKQYSLAALTAALFCAPAAARAAQLDAYREMAARGTFTVRYVITSRQRMPGGGQTSGNMFEKNDAPVSKQGVYAAKGGAQYAEMGKDGKFVCELLRDGRLYQFVRKEKKNGVSSYPVKKIMADAVLSFGLPEDFLRRKMDFGGAFFRRFLSALAPEVYRFSYAPTPRYGYVTEGTLPDGASFEDYSARAEGRFYAMRCYFRDGKLTGADFAVFPTSLEEKPLRYTLAIEAFSADVDEALLRLPESIQVIDTRKGEVS